MLRSSLQIFENSSLGVEAANLQMENRHRSDKFILPSISLADSSPSHRMYFYNIKMPATIDATALIDSSCQAVKLSATSFGGNHVLFRIDVSTEFSETTS